MLWIGNLQSFKPPRQQPLAAARPSLSKEGVHASFIAPHPPSRSPLCAVVCGKALPMPWCALAPTRPFSSIEDLTLRVPELSKSEWTMLAQVGALNGLGERFHRRDALWQVERAIRPAGALFKQNQPKDAPSPLSQMTAEERLVTDFHGTGLTVGRHPMAHRRSEWNGMNIKRACDLKFIADGWFARTAGCVIARQRPGTAKGFLFLSLEDETGIANAIVTPDVYERNRTLLTSGKFLMIEGVLQNQDNVISVEPDVSIPYPSPQLRRSRTISTLNTNPLLPISTQGTSAGRSNAGLSPTAEIPAGTLRQDGALRVDHPAEPHGQVSDVLPSSKFSLKVLPSEGPFTPQVFVKILFSTNVLPVQPETANSMPAALLPIMFSLTRLPEAPEPVRRIPAWLLQEIRFSFRVFLG